MITAELDEMLVSHVDFLKPFAFTLTRNTESSKDLLQETMYRALANKDKYKVGSNIKAWMYTIMRNVFINNYRRKATQQTVFDNSPNDFWLDYNQASVSNNAEVSLHLKDIDLCIYKLPEIFSQPFKMYIEGYKYYEIADILNEPLGTIKSRIHFARKLLKGQLSRH